MDTEQLLNEWLGMKMSLIAEFSGDTRGETIAAIERAFDIAAELGVTIKLDDYTQERLGWWAEDEDDLSEAERGSMRRIIIARAQMRS